MQASTAIVLELWYDIFVLSAVYDVKIVSRTLQVDRAGALIVSAAGRPEGLELALLDFGFAAVIDATLLGVLAMPTQRGVRVGIACFLFVVHLMQLLTKHPNLFLLISLLSL